MSRNFLFDFWQNNGSGSQRWVILLLLAFVSCGQPGTRKAAPATVTAADDLPAITLIDESGKSFSAKELPGRTILIFFGAGCDHCQREAKQIHEHLTAFAKYSVYFISMDPFPVIHRFADDYGISGKPNIRFLRADGDSVNKTLGYLQTPTLFIFDDHRHLIKRFDGETEVTEILRVL